MIPEKVVTVLLTAPLAMWIVFSGSRGDHRQTADFVGSMIAGFVGSRRRESSEGLNGHRAEP